jgi:hypothetical protein
LILRRQEKGSTGIFIDQKGMTGVRLRADKSSIVKSVYIPFDTSLIEGNFIEATLYDSNQLSERIKELFIALGVSKNEGMFEARVCIDDYFTNTLILDMAALPDNEEFAARILEKRIHQLYGYLKNQELLLSYTVLKQDELEVQDQGGAISRVGPDHSGVRVLVTYILKSFSDSLKSAFYKADVNVSGLETAWNNYLSCCTLLENQIWAFALSGSLASTILIMSSKTPVFVRKANRGFDDLSESGLFKEIQNTISYFSDNRNIPVYLVTVVGEEKMAIGEEKIDPAALTGQSDRAVPGIFLFPRAAAQEILKSQPVTGLTLAFCAALGGELG